VAIVNEEFARRHYGGSVGAMGRHFGVIVRGERREVVRVVGNTWTAPSDTRSTVVHFRHCALESMDRSAVP
jgi:hypothetical protein